MTVLTYSLLFLIYVLCIVTIIFSWLLIRQPEKNFLCRYPKLSVIVGVILLIFTVFVWGLAASLII
jgi:cytochrome bd-type quinol oxidase subunit 1